MSEARMTVPRSTDFDPLIENDQMIDLLRKSIISGNRGLSSIPDLLKSVLREGRWKKRTIRATGAIQEFRSFEDFVRTPALEGLGCDMDLIKKLVSGDTEASELLALTLKEGAPKQGRPKKEDNILLLEPKANGTSTRASLNRLRNNHPEIHARVLAGELSPHAGMIEAGRRKRNIQAPAEPVDLARYLLRKYDLESLATIAGMIMDHVEAAKDAEASR